MSLGLLIPVGLILSGAVDGPHILNRLIVNGSVNQADETVRQQAQTELFMALFVMILIVPTLAWSGSGIMFKVLMRLKPAWNQKGINWSIPWSSWLLLSLGWGMHGISYGLTLRGISATPINWLDWPMWTAAVSWATAGAFFVFLIPGGLGVREGLLIEFLRIQPGIGPRLAVVSALTLRLVWLLGEFTIATILFFYFRPRRNEVPAAELESSGSDRSM